MIYCQAMLILVVNLMYFDSTLFLFKRLHLIYLHFCMLLQEVVIQIQGLGLYNSPTKIYIKSAPYLHQKGLIRHQLFVADVAH